MEDEPFKHYNQRLLEWDKNKTETYSKTFNEVKANSPNLVTELEELVTKLGLGDK